MNLKFKTVNSHKTSVLDAFAQLNLYLTKPPPTDSAFRLGCGLENIPEKKKKKSRRRTHKFTKTQQKSTKQRYFSRLVLSKSATRRPKTVG